MEKFAVLIMAHNQFSILEKLMKQLDHERNHLYIHIDRKSKRFNQNAFSQICVKSKVTFINRMSVHWGDYSQIECELRLIKAALDAGEEYSYFHLLSGCDLQIKRNEEVQKFFDEHPHKQFLALRNTASGLEGLAYYYWFYPLRSYNRIIGGGLQHISIRLQKLLKINLLKKINYPLCKTQQWFSITKEFAEYVLSQRKFIREMCHATSCADEMFMGTILVNSPFRDQLYQPFYSPYGHMRLIDRTRPEKAAPHTWRMEDWDMIQNSACFWARKFNEEIDDQVINKVYEQWH